MTWLAYDEIALLAACFWPKQTECGKALITAAAVFCLLRITGVKTNTFESETGNKQIPAKPFYVRIQEYSILKACGVYEGRRPGSALPFWVK